jgi:hypothetical protein
MEAPLDHGWTEIYLHVTTRVCLASDRHVPEDVRVDKLSSWQASKLRDLKAWIYEKRRARRPKKVKNALAPTGPKAEAVGKCLQSVSREAPALATQSELFADLS